ncbi:SpoIID/LytB domain-containing protein [Aeromicrobium sp. CF4.19]|uniref:SpoIID/LytB domain-containing protein n=1 Tax=Aeromicrobium sp. CF4.19 TaxID=3373082 RepID=UPI003EE7E7BD
MRRRLSAALGAMVAIGLAWLLIVTAPFLGGGGPPDTTTAQEPWSEPSESATPDDAEPQEPEESPEVAPEPEASTEPGPGDPAPESPAPEAAPAPEEPESVTPDPSRPGVSTLGQTRIEESAIEVSELTSSRSRDDAAESDTESSDASSASPALFGTALSTVARALRTADDDPAAEPSEAPTPSAPAPEVAPRDGEDEGPSEEAPEDTGDEDSSEGTPEEDPEDDTAEDGTQRQDRLPFQLVGVTWAEQESFGGVEFAVQVRQDGQWSEWYDLPQAGLESDSAGDGVRGGTDPVWVGPSDGIALRATVASGAAAPSDVKLTTIDGGDDPGTAGQADVSSGAVDETVTQASYDPRGTQDGVAQAQTVAAKQPSITMRSRWGASGSSCSQSTGSFRAIMMHHTAGNNSYSSSQSAGLVRGIQSYHKGMGWCDIGYNFLVDKYGKIFEGRAGGITRMVRGAHAGSWNTNTVGISMMGNYDTTRTTSAMQSAVVRLAAWRMSIGGIPAKGRVSVAGKSINRIAMHRDVMATACPGRYGVQWITGSGGMRDRVASAMSGAASYRWNAPTGFSATAASPTSLNLKWNSVSTAKKYVVQLSTSSSMSNPKHYAFTSTSGTVTGLKTDTRYYVRVIVRHSKTNEALSPWTAKKAPVTYRWKAPAAMKVTDTSSSSMGLSWGAVSGAKKYVVQVSRSASMSSPKHFAFTSNKGTVDKLAASGKHYVRVIVRHSKTNEALSPWSTVASGTTTAPAPTYRWEAPAAMKVTSTSSSSMGLSWGAVSGAKKYVVQVSRSASMSSPKHFAFTSNKGTVDKLAASGKHYVRVIVRHSKTNEALSPWSTVASGTTTAPAPTYRWKAPAAMKVTSTTSSSMALSWGAVSGAKKYVVQISRSPSMSNPSFRAFTTNKGTISSIQPSQKYYVRVIVRHSKTNEALSPWSTVASGTTKAKSANTVNSRTVGSASSVSFKGHGYGHGIGMSQWGAYGGASKGALASAILKKYYPGTTLADRSRYIRVHLTADNDGSTAVLAQSGLKLLQGSRTVALPTSVSGRKVSHWRIEPYASNRRQSVLRYKSGSTWRTYQSMVWSGSADFAAPTMRLALPGGKTVTYRYKLRAAQPSSTSTSRRTVNVLHLNDYTRGVIPREVPASWPNEALRSQAIAARTYGLRAISSGGWYDICDTTSCQVYGGVSAEASRTNSAVSSTSNRVLLYQGSPAFTQFSSSSGGYTNKGSQPYLKPVSDPWDNTSANANHSWSQAVKTSTIQSRYPSIGTLRTVKVTKRNGHGSQGGRVVSMQLVGSKKTVTISGTDARWSFGLKSDWFGF